MKLLEGQEGKGASPPVHPNNPVTPEGPTGDLGAGTKCLRGLAWHSVGPHTATLPPELNSHPSCLVAAAGHFRCPLKLCCSAVKFRLYSQKLCVGAQSEKEEHSWWHCVPAAVTPNYWSGSAQRLFCLEFKFTITMGRKTHSKSQALTT